MPFYILGHQAIQLLSVYHCRMANAAIKRMHEDLALQTITIKLHDLSLMASKSCRRACNRTLVKDDSLCSQGVGVIDGFPACFYEAGI